MRLSKPTLIYAGMVGVFLIYKFIQLTYPSIPFVHAYLEDVLAIPIVLKSAEFIIRLIPGKQDFRVRIMDVVVTTLMFSIYFEWWIPKVDLRFTSDLYDLIAYACGAGIFLFLLSAPNPNHNSTSN